MRTNTLRHKILVVLNEQYRKAEENAEAGKEATEVARCLSAFEIHQRTGLDLKVVDDICFTLVGSEHLKLISDHYRKDFKKYMLTGWGRETLINNWFPHREKSSNWNLAKDILLVIAAIGGLVLSIYTTFKSANNEKEIRSLKTEIEKLKK